LQILVLVVFLIAWLLTFWLGAIAFEITGMERSKARFQALSALSGTGFTTSEAESVVNHPGRRRIATWLIFIGNTGIIAFILILILYLRNGLITPTLPYIIFVLLPLLVLALSVRFGIVNKLSTAIVRSLRKGSSASGLVLDELLLQTGEYGIARLAVKWHKDIPTLKLKDYDLPGKEISILAIERGATILPFPMEDEMLLEGDRLLCYGKWTEMPVSGLRAT
jgi:Trk-type K+ transport system membrane component